MRLANQFFVAIFITTMIANNTMAQEDATEDQKQPARNTAEQAVDPTTDEYQQELVDLEQGFKSLVLEFVTNDQDDSVARRSIQIAQQRGYVTERFNAEVFTIFRQASRAQEPDADAVTRGLSLLQLTTLEPDDKARLLLDCYTGISTNSPNHRLLSSLRRAMRQYGTQIQSMLVRRLQSEPVNMGLLELIDTDSPDSIRVLPQLMELCRSDDRDLAVAALNHAHEILVNLRRTSSRSNERFTRPPPMVATRNWRDQIAGFFARADRNSDGGLSAGEIPEQLLEAMDSNGDGSVTEHEFAQYGELRRQRAEASRDAAAPNRGR